MGLNEIIKLIQERDGISYLEAVNCVKECQDELMELLEDNPSYDAAADCIADCLGLEPDYLDILLPL